MGELDKLRDARVKMSQYFPLTQGAVVIFMLVQYKYVKHYQKLNIYKWSDKLTVQNL